MLFGALEKWMHSHLKNRESAVKKHKETRKSKLDKKLKSINAWRKVSTVILICSVVAAAMAAPRVAAALAAAASILLGSMGRWIDSLLKNYENAVKGQKEIINCMNVGTYIAIKDLDNILVLVDRLDIEIESLIKTNIPTIEECRMVKMLNHLFYC